MKLIKKRIIVVMVILTCICGKAFSSDFFVDRRAQWLEKAKRNTPTLVVSEKHPVNMVAIVEDTASFQKWKAVPAGNTDSFYGMEFTRETVAILDFGEHLTGHVSFSLAAGKSVPDSPVRLKFTFGETPAEVAVPFDPYPGGLSRAWLQDETVTVTTVPGTMEIPRRLSFRYVKIEITAVPNYGFSFSGIVCRATTSAVGKIEPLPASAPQIIRDIDRVAQATLKECMQTVYEDGPKRDRRLWSGDLYLESLGNNYSFRQFDITRRCLYLLAGVCSSEGYIYPCVFEEPEPHNQGVILYEYALLFGVTLKDYLEASGDKETVEDLWPLVKRQIDIVRQYLGQEGLLNFDKLQKDVWVFVDWKEGLHKEVAAQGVTLFALRQTLELAKMLGRENEVTDVPDMIKKMTAAAQKAFLDKRTGLYAGKTNKQVSFASQIWMVLGEVATGKDGVKALTALEKAEKVCIPGTPYLYHYYIQALINCGMNETAREKLTEFWGGMVKKGADTFWEAYDPNNDFISPYNFYPVNSYCHAWSCTPVYFIRKYSEIFSCFAHPKKSGKSAENKL